MVILLDGDIRLGLRRHVAAETICGIVLCPENRENLMNNDRQPNNVTSKQTGNRYSATDC